MESIINYCLNKSRLIITLFVLLLISGQSAYKSIPKESSPDITIPIIWVYVSYNGVNIFDCEKFIIKPLEKYLKSTDNVKKITSYAGNGYGVVQITFHAGFDSKVALSEVREKVSQAKSELPKGAEEPVINEVNFSQFPIFSSIFYSELPEKTTNDYLNDLKYKIEQIPEILKVEILGFRKEIVEINTTPQIFYNNKLNINYLKDLINNNLNILIAGQLKQIGGNYNFSFPPKIKNYNDINELAFYLDGSLLTPADFLYTTRSFDESGTLARANNKQAFVMQVSKRNGSNIISVIDKVKEQIELSKSNLPGPIEISNINDNSENVKSMLNELENNVILATILALAPVLLTMGLSSSLLVTLAIPGSFLISILVLSAMNYSLNIIVLFSLILSVGMLVDAAIVVCEYADRKIIEGYSPKEAFFKGAHRMAWPVISSVATTVIVFVPLLFWPGITGEFMKYLPITVIITLTSSLFMAFIFIPTIGSVVKKPVKASAEEIAEVRAAEDGDLNSLNYFTKSYVKILEKVLKKPGKFCLLNLGFLILVYIIYVTMGQGIEFFPNVEPENFSITLHSDGNFSNEQLNSKISQLENILEEFKNKNEIKSYYISYGGSSSHDSSTAFDEVARAYIEFTDWKIRKKSSLILNEIMTKTNNISGVFFKILTERHGPNHGKPFNINLLSNDPELLSKYFPIVKNKIIENDNFINIEDNFLSKKIEWEIDINQNLASINKVSNQSISDTVRLYTQGIEIASIRLPELQEETDIILRFNKEYRNLEEMKFALINNEDNELIPISNFVTFKPKLATPIVSRKNGYRNLYLSADIKEGINLNNEIVKIKNILKEINLPNKIIVDFEGDEEEQNETQDFLSVAFYISLFGILIIFLIQFNSFYYSFVIMSAIIFSTVGVLLGLLITFQPFGIVMCGIGIIALAGTVVNHNIIFVDTFIKMDSKMPITEKLIRTGAQRIRPILLTTLTAILGLLPMVFKISIDLKNFTIDYNSPSSQWWVQLSTSISGGLAFATLLTLFFTPALLLWCDNLKRKFKGFNIND